MKPFHAVALLLALAAGMATAQTAPTSTEIANFPPLFAAAHDGTAEDVRHALANGADIAERDGKQRLATHVAAFASNEDALRALAAAGADMNALEYRLYDVVTIAAVADDPEMVKTAIALGNRADLVTSIYDGTALIAAAHLGHHRVVDILIANGAPLDHVNNLGWTAVIEAVVLGDGGPDHVETARLLVDAGADLSIPDSAGATPLDHARARGYSEMVKVLEAGLR